MIKSFNEIKNRICLLIVTWASVFTITYYYKCFIILLLIVSNKELSDEVLSYFIITSITELFLLYMKLSFFSTSYVLYFSFLYQGICFSAPGLYKKEYQYFKFIFFTSFIFSFFSFLFFHTTFIPLLSHFFLSYQDSFYLTINLHFEAKISDYFIFYKNNFHSCFLTFQLGIVLILVSNYISFRFKILKIARKFLYLGLLILSTFITPPDIFSQIFTFTSLIIYFEFLVFSSILKKVTQNYYLK